MEALFIFIAKSAGLVILFYAAYYFLLRKETFFNSNRWFLLAGLITSIVLPFLVYTKTIWVASSNELNLKYAPIDAVKNLDKNAFDPNWNYIVLAIYSIGCIAMMIKLAMDFYSLNSVLKGKKVHQQADFKFIDVEENIAPFSYFEYIVYNSSMYSASELESIIEHEKVHSDQNHTVDVLISRAFCVVFWFNPVIWLYKKAIVQNLEFIADKEAAQKIADKKAYQYTLLKITTHENCLDLTNHFYQSLIKKRIVMLNKNQSRKRNSWKYYVVIPALTAFVLLFQVEVIAKEKQESIKKVSPENEAAVSKEDPNAIHVYKIKKGTTNEELEIITKNLKKNHDLDLTVSDLKRNSDNDITSIKADLKNGAEEVQTIQAQGDKGIKDCGIVIVIDEKGKRKINLITDQPYGITVGNKAQIVEVKNVQNSKTNTNVNTNCNIDTKADGTTNTNTTVVVSTNVNETTTSPNVVISTKTRSKSFGVANLIIVDGVVVSPRVTNEDLKSLDIESMHVWKGPEAIAKYGDQGKDGVIVIETKK